MGDGGYLFRKLNINNVPCFDIVFQRPYRYFSMALKSFYPCLVAIKFSPMIDYRLKFFQNVGFSKIDVTMTTINKNL